MTYLLNFAACLTTLYLPDFEQLLSDYAISLLHLLSLPQLQLLLFKSHHETKASKIHSNECMSLITTIYMTEEEKITTLSPYLPPFLGLKLCDLHFECPFVVLLLEQDLSLSLHELVLFPLNFLFGFVVEGLVVFFLLHKVLYLFLEGSRVGG
jgi:hypothetical protein